MWKLLDHVSLIIEVEIKEVNIDVTIWSIKKDSDDKKEFVKSLKKGLELLDTSSITSKNSLQVVII